MSHFDLIAMIGWGAYGKVYLSWKIGGRDDKVLYAIKVQKKRKIVEKSSSIRKAKSERNVSLNIAFTSLT